MDYIEIYGFGSYFKAKEKPKDIDLLIVHQSLEPSSIKLAIKCKKLLKTSLSGADITMLSTKEEKEAGFIETSDAEYLCSIRSTDLKAGLSRLIEKIISIED